MTSTLDQVPAPSTAQAGPDPVAIAETAPRAVPGIDTTRVRAAFQDGAILLVGRVQ